MWTNGAMNIFIAPFSFFNNFSTGSVSKNKYRDGLTASVGPGPVIESSYYDKETSGRGDTVQTLVYDWNVV